MPETMRGAYLPGNSTTELREAARPLPGHGEVVLRMKASTICGSDIRCIYHEHLGKGPEGYQGVIAGHEPSGQWWRPVRDAGVSARATARSSTTSRGVACATIAAAAT